MLPRAHESKSQTASRPVQPFLHSSLQRVPILYNGPPLHCQNCTFLQGDLDPIYHNFLGPIRAHNPNDISIGSAVFAQFTTVLDSSPQTIPIIHNGLRFPSKLPLLMGDLDPHLIYGSLGPPESSNKWHLDWFSYFCRAHYHLTDRPCYLVCNNRPHLCTQYSDAANNICSQ